MRKEEVVGSTISKCAGTRQICPYGYATALKVKIRKKINNKINDTIVTREAASTSAGFHAALYPDRIGIWRC